MQKKTIDNVRAYLHDWNRVCGWAFAAIPQHVLP
jgi:hypothetical protein